MVTKTFLNRMAAAGVILGVATTSVTPAAAQGLLPGTPIASPQAQAAQSASTSLGHSLEDRVLLRGTPEEAARNPRAAGFNPFAQQATEVTRREWLAAGRPEAQFDGFRHQNFGMCLRTTAYIIRTDYLIERQANRRPLTDSIRARYAGLAGRIKTAAQDRHAGNALSVLATGGAGLAIAGPLGALHSGGGALGGAIGNEAMGRVFDESQLTGSDAGLIWSDAMNDSTEASLLFLESFGDYMDLMSDFCVEFLGTVPAQAVTINGGSPYSLSQGGYGAQSTRVTYGREERVYDDRQGNNRRR